MAGCSQDKTENNNYLPNQRKRLLDALKVAPMNTIQIRHELDIFQAATRIFELRHDFNYNIITQWVRQKTPEGHTHRVAKYILLSGKFKDTLE